MSPAKATWPAGQGAVAVTAPAGSVDPAELEAGLAVLGDLAGDRRIIVDEQVRLRSGYLAGDDQERAVALQRLWDDPGVGLIICARGGFGSSRLLPLLDLDAMAHPGKRLMGFSDITCLLNNFASRGLVCVHGPVLTQLPRLDQASLDAVAALVSGASPWPAELTGEPVAGGKARGSLMGGNMTMLCHLIGTPWAPDLAGAILCLEDTGEAPYRLDRMTTKLELAGVLDRVAGVALGALASDGATPPDRLEAIARRLSSLDVPVIIGLPFGHGPENRPLPLGAMASIDGDNGVLEVGLDL